MKRYHSLAVILCAVIMCLLASGCDASIPESSDPVISGEIVQTTETAQPTEMTEQPSQEAPHVSLVALDVGNTSDTSNSAVHTSECEYWPKEIETEFQDDSAPRTMTVSFNGETYTGTYTYSIVRIPEIHQLDYYEFQHESRVAWFSVYHDTGTLESMLFYGEKGELSAEDCLEIATKAAQQFIDTSDYELTVIPGGYIHWFRFIRFLGDVQTADSVSIGVTTGGTVNRLETMQLGEFDSPDFKTASMSTRVTQSLSALHSENARSVLDTKVKQIYGDLNEKYPDLNPKLSYEVTDSLLIRLPDSTLGLLQTVSTDVVLTSKDGQISHDRSLFQILVKCEPES